MAWSVMTAAQVSILLFDVKVDCHKLGLLVWSTDALTASKFQDKNNGRKDKMMYAK